MKNYWSTSFASVVVAVPLLMGAKGGCGGDVSMGSDYAGAGGMNSSKGGETAVAQGGGMVTTGGLPSMTAQGGGMATTGGSPNRSCDAYENSGPGEEVTIRYVNASAAPIYVGRTNTDCANEPLFALFSQTGERRSFPNVDPFSPLSWEDELCMTCELVQQGRPECSLVCLYGTLVRIDPGGSYDTSWLGVYFETQAMPAACYFDPRDVLATCSQVVSAKAGAYRIVGTAWPAFSCGPGGMCDCRPEDSGDTCSLDLDAAVSGVPRQVSATLDFPNQKLVELRFE